MLLKFVTCVSAAGTRATEERGGAGEHPRVCEDEEQPAQDQAGDRRRGANHLKTSKGVWLWLMAREIVGPKTFGVSVRKSKRERGLVFGGDLTVVQDELPGFSTLSCSFLQWGERLYILKTALLPSCPPARDCQYTPLLLTTIQQHTAPPAGGTWHGYVMLPFSELPVSSDGENTHAGVFIPSVFTHVSTVSSCVPSPFSVLLLLFMLFLSLQSNKQKWTLDRLLKLCNVKAKQNVLLLFMFVAFSPGYMGGHS